jgi:Zinc carboxypeptidase
MTYLNTNEVDSALAGLAAAYPTLCGLIALPYSSIEGRTCYALRIGRKTAMADAVLFTACAHGREWGGAEICVYFAADLLEAYSLGTGLAYGQQQFSSLTVRRILERLNVIVLPCINPDGRAWDQLDPAQHYWRKNRNPTHATGDPQTVGVDLNRNYDFLWDFPTKFHPQVDGPVGSNDPSSQYFHGDAAESEPEVRNVRWLLDSHQFVRWHLDIHSFTGDVLFVWNDDEDQTVDPSMNFRNLAYDGQRGITGGYAEYIPTKERTLVAGIAQRVVTAVNAVRGGHYEAKQSVYLSGASTAVSYPVSGAICDYAYSRHFSDWTKSKVYSFTVEFGYYDLTHDFPTNFHPPWTEMEQIVAEIDAGMLELCAAALPPLAPPWTWFFRRLSQWQVWDSAMHAMQRGVGPLVERVRNSA